MEGCYVHSDLIRRLASSAKAKSTQVAGRVDRAEFEALPSPLTPAAARMSAAAIGVKRLFESWIAQVSVNCMEPLKRGLVNRLTKNCN